MHRRSPKLSRSEAAREHLTILHLSDPQFGKNHRFGSEELDPYLPQPLRIPDDQPLIPELSLPNETTLRTFRQTDEGKDLVRCTDAEDMLGKLGL